MLRPALAHYFSAGKPWREPKVASPTESSCVTLKQSDTAPPALMDRWYTRQAGCVTREQLSVTTEDCTRGH